ncbi:MAG: hypothetical protein HWN81_20935 [Candidatus Lokiarchaeota archaeon]|nr:hypothetical protein [Candidatus Lokiarchaeota archaeon]
MAVREVYPPVATVGGLTAVAGGGAYSIFKNFKTASDINEQRQYSSEILKNMREWVGVDNVGELLRKLGMTQEEAENLLAGIDVVNESTGQSYKYAVINTAVQMTLSIISIWINAIASRRDNDDVSIDTMNMLVVPVLIFSQYVIHSAFVARPLRKISDQSAGVKSKLEKLKDSPQVQLWRLSKLIGEIEDGYQELKKLNGNIRNNSETLFTIREEERQIRKQPIAVGFNKEKEIEERLTELLNQRSKLEQEIIIQNESRQQFTKHLRALINDANKLIVELELGFASYQHFNDVSRHFEEIQSLLSQEMDNLSFSLTNGII